jgi:flagellar hook-associated protein 3 FlgL
MRLSTAGMHASALAGMAERSADLVRTQGQIATGKRIQTPADDPAGSVRALELDRGLAESQQFARNADVATSRLSLEEQTLTDAANLLQRVRELAVQGNNATIDQNARQALASELQVRFNELVDIGNRRDANGEYLFSGYSTQTKPFAQSGNSVTYAGDQGVRVLQTSPTQRIPDGHSGFEVFQNIAEGNGTFVTGANIANNGGAVIDGGSVTNPALWVPDTYSLNFTSASAWEVRNSSNALVASGAYAGNGTINFNGVQVTLTGQPATGDRFSIRPSDTQDMFATVANALSTLQRATVTAADRAQFATAMGATLTQIDRGLDHVSSVRADIGARLITLDDSQTNRDDRDIELQKELSNLRDLDYAKAITQLNLQQMGLQAAQASYSRIAQLSLFDYLR